MPRFSRSGCPSLQTAAVILVLALLSGCKARNDSASRLRSDSTADSGSSPELGVGWLLDQIETDLARIEPEVQLAGDPMAGSGLDVQGLALADGSIDERQHMLKLAKDLDSYAADKVIADRHAVEAVAEELEGLADLLSGLSASDKKRAADAVSRVRAILASPPNMAGDVPHATPPPPAQRPTTQQQQTSTENDAPNLYCKNLGNRSWLPAIRNGITFGFAVQNGGQGFTQNPNCESAVINSRNGLVCSISSDDRVSPFRIRNGEMVGPKIGFAQTANCVAAVKYSNDTICIVDNRPGVGKYAKYNVETGRVVDYWFDDAERCRRGDKAPDPKRVCLDRCQSEYDRCYARAKRLTGMDQTSARIQCLHDRMVVCENRC